MKNMTIEAYLLELASKKAVPGGGSASALSGALGIALGSMVGNLTLGKKKYAEYEADIKRLLQISERLQSELTELIQKDAEVFEPIAEGYRLPKETEEQRAYRDELLQMRLLDAAMVPFAIVEAALQAIAVLEELLDKGSVLAVSDIGVGAAFLRAAADGASLSVYINTKMMKNRRLADELNQATRQKQQETAERADLLYQRVRERLF